MKLKWIATAAFGVALAPGIVFAQSKTSTTDTTKTSAAKQTTSTTSTGDVSSSSSDISKNVTPAMIKAQDDPNLIGSPAWWKTHSTADGKPLDAKTQTGKPQ